MRVAGSCLVFLVWVFSAAAQPAPFDMSDEAPQGALKDVAPAHDQPLENIPGAAKKEGRVRYLLPFENLMMTGEYDRKSWTIYLTPEQAETAAKLNVGYLNSILVAPETSSLGILINDTLVGESAIDAPETEAQRSFDLPGGVMRPGVNTISVLARQRHRTDCTVQSTYELWTEVASKHTYISFDRERPNRMADLNDVRAVGVNEAGQTRFKLVVPRMEQPAATTPLMRLSQSIAMLAGMPNQSFEFITELPEPSTPGQVTVAVGTASELAEVLPGLPASAGSASFMGFVNHPTTGEPVLAISGPTWQSMEAPIETIAALVNREQGVQREALMTQRWTGNDAPLLTQDARLPFSRLGMPTIEFSGRRLRTGFVIAVPSDFYADAYGEARILLDAAYSNAVLPGSRIDIYVNGNIASTVPVTSGGGGIFRHLPIGVTMRHFKPGANHIEIETVVLTQEDEVCSPGAAAGDEPRFAIFDTSEFHMPDFARIAQLPNLAAAAGTGFPYGNADRTSLFLNRADEKTLSAAATLLGKLAVASGRLVPIVSEYSAQAIGNGNAIFLGEMSQMPPLALDQVGLADESRTLWDGKTDAGSTSVNTGAVFDEWRSKVSSGSWSGQVSALEEWLVRTFDISLSSLRFAPSNEDASVPPQSASLIVAQGTSPSEEGTWTLVAAPTATDLMDSMAILAEQRNWRTISGHMALYKPGDESIEVRPTNRFAFLQTQPISLRNVRLIAANWLSTNILSYAVILVAFSLLLGIATSMFLNRLGRRH